MPPPDTGTGKMLRHNRKSHVGSSYLHNAFEDHLRLAYSETRPPRSRRESGRTMTDPQEQDPGASWVAAAVADRGERQPV
ncbi:hypothetical protein OG225_08010 [Nocardia sp. NBC_01377]|uniref:hypothetical protein n=1 Tax=Nocardia sp. NBC_01377 TaxID=2903595 RepID=UPI003244CCAD